MDRHLDERVAEVVNPLSPLKENMMSEWLNAAHLIVDLWDEVSRLRARLATIPMTASELESYPIALRD